MNLSVVLQKRNWRAAARSDCKNEGGLVMERGVANDDEPPLGQAELKQLRIRAVVLEGVVLALLAGASDPQRKLVAQMA